LSSSPFRFLAGRDRRLFTVHSSLIAHHSKPLDILVNEYMSEAKKECALLKDVEEKSLCHLELCSDWQRRIYLKSGINLHVLLEAFCNGT